MSRFKFIVVCAIAAFCNTQVNASQVTYDFSFTATEGSLAGNSYSGSLSYDSSIVLPGQIAYGTNLLSNLSFTFAGQNYSTANTSSVDLSWNMAGNLSGLLIGTNCNVSDGCTVRPGMAEWSLVLYPVSPAYSTLYYSFPSDSVYSADNFAVSVSPVPEPAPLVLLASGLLAVLACGRSTRKSSTT